MNPPGMLTLSVRGGVPELTGVPGIDCDSISFLALFSLSMLPDSGPMHELLPVSLPSDNVSLTVAYDRNGRSIKS